MEKHFRNIQSTFDIKDGIKIYNINYCLRYLEYQGKIRYGRYFQIESVDEALLYKLIVYAIKDEKRAQKLNLDLNKGLLLIGPVGCGKTSLMALLRPFFSHKSDYAIKTCREIAFEYAKRPDATLKKYTQKVHTQSRLTGYCFDDLGAEQNIKHYGEDFNIMAEIIISRYEDFVQNQSVTHITTNLSLSEIEALYGNRLGLMLRSMFNLITFSNESRDKR